MTGAAIIIFSVLAGMSFAALQGFDGAQTFMACLFIWFWLWLPYKLCMAVASRRRRR